MKLDIITFGSAVIDAFVETELNKKTKTFSYQAGSKILINNLQFDIGGGATNTAVAFARLNFKTGCICKIGNDNNSKDILNLLKKEKIKFLGSHSKTKTGYSIILDSKDKSRTILTFKGPGNHIKLNELPTFKTNWLYYSSVLGESFKTQIALAKKLTKQGTKLAFNPSEYLVKNTDITQLLKITDILILNKEEAEILCKKNKKKTSILLQSLTELGPKIVVVTNKNNPIKCYNGAKTYTIKPNKIKVVERTGAGDAFASGFVAGIMANKSIQEALKLGLKEGESVIKYFGAKNKLIKINLKK